MPAHSRRDRDAPTTTTETNRSESTARGPDNSDLMSWLRGLFGTDEEQQSTVDNQSREAVRDTIGEVVPGTTTAVTTDEDLPDTLARVADEDTMAAIEEEWVPKETRAEGADKVTLSAGKMYTVTADDLSGSDKWKALARNFGMSPEHLRMFNTHILESGVDAPTTAQHSRETTLEEGAQIYIPSAEEVLFAQCRAKTGDYDLAVDLFGQMKLGPNVEMLTAARDRASGRVGESYGTKGVDGGKFLTRNAELAGASNRRSEMINGHREYAVMWLPDFWKCSLFLHDVAFQAVGGGDLRSNNHYMVAGRLHQSKKYEEVSVDKARPGDAYQRFGGTGSDESHNAVLSTWVEKEDTGGDRETWTFSIIGAETDRAAESEKTKYMKKGTNQTTDGKTVRFLRPKV